MLDEAKTILLIKFRNGKVQVICRYAKLLVITF